MDDVVTETYHFGTEVVSAINLRIVIVSQLLDTVIYVIIIGFVTMVILCIVLYNRIVLKHVCCS